MPRPPWIDTLHADRELLRRSQKASLPDDAAARLADSRYSAELEAELASVRESGRAALARGRRALVGGRAEEAAAHLVRAQARATARDPLVVGRTAFLLAAIHLDRGERVAADAALAWAEGLLGQRADRNADVLHLRALMAADAGDRDRSVALYRKVLERASEALTPLTRVLAMRNLASTIAHAHPYDSVGLYAMALALLEAEELDVALRPAIANGLGYALLCTGAIADARVKLEQALEEARAEGSDRIAIFASFNLAIADELAGDPAGAVARLDTVEASARAQGNADMVGWASIRRAWLALRLGDASRTLHHGSAGAPSVDQREPVATVSALSRLSAHPSPARDELARLAEIYAGRGDALIEFVLRLWTAHADVVAGRMQRARAEVARACALGTEGGFRLSTSWWAPEVVTVARELAPLQYADFAERLLPAAAAVSTSRPAVELSRTGDVTIDGRALGDGLWRRGRSGSGVLRRYFRALLSAHPAPLARDELADLLWPESEGDKAIRNLYDATKDLRRVLADIPGVQLRVEDGRYALRLEEGIRVS